MDESAIFAAALERSDPAARDEFLDEACGGDARLRARVDGLLRAHENPESFLEDPAAQVIGQVESQATVVPGDEPREGGEIGAYKLLQQIGEGGMGVVFMAEQTAPVKRRVALKVIKPGMDSREVIARFEAERQALAMMDHPGIARVLDAGTTSGGRPYFVMELVHGLPITEYCDEHRLDTRARLELFTAVCQAVQHAHQKGVIHRDLKPSNILVAEYDHEAVPKVIDFGVAKATSQQLTEKTLFTQFGQIVGTLEYMSPEQAKRNQLDVDTRSDIYSLGIVLFELLTGETPFDKQRLRSAAFDEMLKIIREEDPPRPSIKLSSGQSLDQVARKRGVEPGRLTALVRGDLDWIVLKTLSKDRSGRYGTASELAADVTRHLQQQPILAGPPRVLSRATKFVARNRGIVTTALLAAGVLLLVGLWLANVRRERQVRVAERSHRAALALDDAALSLGLAIASPVGRDTEWAAAEAGRTRVHELLDEGPVGADVRQRGGGFQAQFDAAQANRRLAERIEEVVIYGATHPDLASWERMEQDMRSLFLEHDFDLRDGDPTDIAQRIRSHESAAQWSDALELWIATRAQMSTLGGPQLNAAIMQPWAEAMSAADPDPVRNGLRRLIYSGRPPTKEQVEAVVQDRSLPQLRVRTLSWLATIYHQAGAIPDSDRVFRLALRYHPGDVMLNFDYGYSLYYQQRWQEAIRMFMRCLVVRPDVGGIWQTMGLALEKVDEPENARRALQRACDLEPDYGPSWVNLGNLLLRMDRTSEALAAGRRAVKLNPRMPAPHGVVGRALMAGEEYAEALEALQACEQYGANDRTWREQSADWLRECREKLAGE